MRDEKDRITSCSTLMLIINYLDVGARKSIKSVNIFTFAINSFDVKQLTGDEHDEKYPKIA